MKKTLVMIALAGVLSLGALNLALAGDAAYYGSHPTTVEELCKVWGRPAHVLKSADGKTALVFDKNANGFPYANRYFVVQGGKVVDGGLNIQFDQAPGKGGAWVEAPKSEGAGY